MIDKEYHRKWYHDNKIRIKDRKLGHRKLFKEKRKKFLEGLKSKPCMDCGGSFPPYVMDFDHRCDKEFNIANGIYRISEARILEEVSKCDLVCSNCHRVRTYNRREVAQIRGAYDLES